MMKNYILQEAALLINITWTSRSKPRKKNHLVQLQTRLRWKVRDKEWWTTRNGDSWFQAAFLWKTGLYCGGQKTSLASHETVMVIRKQNSTKSGRRIEQRSSNSTEENGNHTEETQQGPSLIPPNIRVGQENG